MAWERRDTVGLLGLTLAWAAVLAWIGPAGEFPISDDFAYHYAVASLIEDSELRTLAWAWVPAVSNAGWGFLFAKLFGLSFETLRASSLVMGWLGAVGCFALARQLGAGSAAALLAAAVVAFNPLSLPISFTFLTDSAFAAFVTWSLFFVARGLPSLRPAPLVAAGLLAAAAALSRQPGMAIFACVGLAALIRWPSRLGWGALLGAGALVVWLGVDAQFQRGFLALNWYLRKILGDPERAIYSLARNTIVIGYLFGALLAPLVLASGRDLVRSRGLLLLTTVAAALGSTGVIAGLLYFDFGAGPPGVDWLHDFGIGPAPAADAAVLPSIPPIVWWAGGLVGGAASGAILARFGVVVWEKRITAAWLGWFPVAAFVAVYLLALGLRNPFFDRYLIAILPASAAFLAAAAPRTLPPARLLAALALAIPVWIYALAGTHDWMERERARWHLLDGLLAQGISSKRIDGGGVAFNGHFNYDDAATSRRFVDDDEWIVSPRPEIAGYAVEQRRAYRAVLPRGEREVFVHRRRPGS